MKKIMALLIAAIMLVSSFVGLAAEPVAFGVEAIDVKYGNGAEKSDSITVKGTYDKPVVLRVFDNNGTVIYIDTAASKDGVFEFGSFELERPDVSELTGTTSGNTTTYDMTYQFVISDDTSILNEADKNVTFQYAVKKSSGSSGGTGVSNANEKTDSDTGWNEEEQSKDENTIKDSQTGETQKRADEDTIYEPVVKDASKQTSASGGAKFIDKTTEATSKESLQWESTRNTIAVSVETMMANISSKKISASSATNNLVLRESSIGNSDLKKYTDTEKTLKDAVDKNKITLNRELSKEYIVNTTFNTSKKANITIYKGFVTKLEKIGIETLTINDKNFRVSYSITELNEMMGDKEYISLDIDTTAMKGSTKKLAVSFDTDKTQTIKISFPGLGGDSKYMAIIDENGNPIGGRYNPATGAIEAKIAESGVYQIVNNEKDFEDIKNLSEEMQESIKILAAKGIIEGTSLKEFSPEDTISRAEVAALLLRVLSQVDPNADGEFIDVKKSDWFYGTAGSAKKYGMILGFEDNTFRGNTTIAKDQILAIASRVLKREMKYKTPENVGEWLTFADANVIAGWAREDIALATMANIITRNEDNTIKSNEDMTRGDAALIIMRLFYKIW